MSEDNSAHTSLNATGRLFSPLTIPAANSSIRCYIRCHAISSLNSQVSRRKSMPLRKTQFKNWLLRKMKNKYVLMNKFLITCNNAKIRNWRGGGGAPFPFDASFLNWENNNLLDYKWWRLNYLHDHKLKIL